MIKKYLIFVSLLSWGLLVYSQNDSIKTSIKKGWSAMGVPVIAGDSDVGLKYGAVLTLYHYGDGSGYPKYDHSFFFEWSRTTKNSGINEFTYDSEKLIPGIRVSAEASYLTEKALDFYGFNGYQTVYNAGIEDSTSSCYKSELFYRQERKMLRLRTDFQGAVKSLDHLNWFAGIAHYNIKTDTVDLKTLNKGREIDFPSADGGLFGVYNNMQVIPTNQGQGGVSNLLKLGLVYDTRNNEPNPTQGIWSEVQLVAALPLLNSNYQFLKLCATHRHYFSLVPGRLSLAHRISYQVKVAGNMPYYMLPFVFNTAPSKTRDGLGGAKTLRGILRNRIVGEGYLYGNNELRWKFYKNIHFNQNIYVALTGFVDYGMVTQNYQANYSAIRNTPEYSLIRDSNDKLHLSAGSGLYIAMNENFVIAAVLGKALSEDDGNTGVYVGLNFLY